MGKFADSWFSVTAGMGFSQKGFASGSLAIFSV
jgi:hypothetical protein